MYGLEDYTRIKHVMSYIGELTDADPPGRRRRRRRRLRRASPPAATSSSTSSSPTTTWPRAERGRGGRRPRFVAAQVDASSADARSRRWSASTAITHVMNAVDPRFVMPIFDGAFAGRRRLPRHGDVAVAAAPRAPYAETGVKLGDEQFAQADEWEAAGSARAGRHRRRAGAVRRVRAVRRRPPVQRDRRARRPRRRQPRPSTATTSRRRSRSGRRSRSASTRRWSGRRTAAGSPPSRSASRRSSTSPRASGRSSA